MPKWTSPELARATFPSLLQVLYLLTCGPRALHSSSFLDELIPILGTDTTEDDVGQNTANGARSGEGTL